MSVSVLPPLGSLLSMRKELSASFPRTKGKTVVILPTKAPRKKAAYNWGKPVLCRKVWRKWAIRPSSRAELMQFFLAFSEKLGNCAQFCWLLPVPHVLAPVLQAGFCINVVAHRKSDKNLSTECHSLHYMLMKFCSKLQINCSSWHLSNLNAREYTFWVDSYLLPAKWINKAFFPSFQRERVYTWHLLLKLGRQFHSNCNAQQPLIF